MSVSDAQKYLQGAQYIGEKDGAKHYSKGGFFLAVSLVGADRVRIKLTKTCAC